MRIDATEHWKSLVWAADKCQVDSWPNDAVALTVWHEENNRRAVFVFTDVDSEVTQVHIAADGSNLWAHRDILTRVKAFAFRARKWRIVYAKIAAKNKNVIIFALKSGFEIEARLRGGAANGDDAIIMTLHPEKNPMKKE